MTVTAILPVTDETASLRKTVEVLPAENRPEISEILIIACQRTTRAALAVAEELGREHAGLIQVRFQQRPFLAGAMRDAFDWASGSHVLMMASDLETDRATMKELIAKAKDGYDIVTATRWKGGSGFRGYNPLKRFLNGIFQMIFRILHGTALSDLTYGFGSSRGSG